MRCVEDSQLGIRRECPRFNHFRWTCHLTWPNCQYSMLAWGDPFTVRKSELMKTVPSVNILTLFRDLSITQRQLCSMVQIPRKNIFQKPYTVQDFAQIEWYADNSEISVLKIVFPTYVLCSTLVFNPPLYYDTQLKQGKLIQRKLRIG